MSFRPYEALAEQFSGPDLDDMLEVILHELPNQLTRIESSLSTGDTGDLRQAAHRLKSTLMLMSDSQGQQLCQSVERQADDATCLALAAEELYPHAKQVHAQLREAVTAAGNGS